MKFDISYFSSNGGRCENEDSLCIKEYYNGLLAIVADGLGGCQNGKEASLTAVNVISSTAENHWNEPDILMRSITAANSELRQLDDQLTTVAALNINGSSVCAAHIGDSRIYQFRGQEIIYQSMDHSVSQMAVLSGEITPDQIRGHIDRNKLIRALGMSDQVAPYIKELSLYSGDSFLICSDGFWELITEEEMVSALSVAQTANDWLGEMRKAIDNKFTSNTDNSSAIVIISE